jgi:hypothetical protein
MLFTTLIQRYNFNLHNFQRNSIIITKGEEADFEKIWLSYFGIHVQTQTKKSYEDSKTNLLTGVKIRIMGFLSMKKELILLHYYIATFVSRLKSQIHQALNDATKWISYLYVGEKYVPPLSLFVIRKCGRS